MKQQMPRTQKRQGRSIPRWQMLTLAIMLVLFGLVGIGSSLVGLRQLATEGLPEKELVVQNKKTEEAPVPFPLSVDPAQKLIVENPGVETYFEEHVDSRPLALRSHTGWFGRALATLAHAGWFQNLASLSSRTLVIQSGERREEVAKNFGDILKWDRASRELFEGHVAGMTPMMSEGKFFPATYIVPKEATPIEVADVVLERFNGEVLARYDDSIADVVPLHDTLVIASLLEREAYDFQDMRHISGVIWNRLFINMPLQIDATLQYAKGSEPNEPWWPKVIPQDKFIVSAFNTYANEGLPPAPIANPSLDAILAALNPKKTDCYYYFHDKQGEFHCSATYEEHVRLLKQYYGRGK